MEQFPNSEQLKKMSVREMEALASQLRKTIIETVAENGGHLASNLGAVELTLALHYVFDLDKDRLIFDVGHQCYTHKLLTGREEDFHALRKQGGASGFPQREEHESDAFTAGHASTAISAAVGMAYARRMLNEDYAVVAVVGDGALSGGLCYEAINDAGQNKLPLIIILNDNDMSIAKSVGALSRHLTQLRQGKHHRSMEHGFGQGVAALPVVGKSVYRGLKKVRTALRSLIVDDRFFSTLGFSYVGPLDGHDLKQLIQAMKRIQKTDGPVLLHVVTQKGHGYTPAENAPEAFHGIAPFFVESGETRRAHSEDSVSCGEIACTLLSDMADEDPTLCGITAAMPQGTGMSFFEEWHPDRFFDVGIAEEHAVIMAGAMASRGMHPYVAIYSTFMERAYDEMLIDICRNKLPVTFLLDRAGLVGADGATHQGVFDLSFLRSMPNMVIAAPRDRRELKKMIEFSRSCQTPMAIRYPKELDDLGEGLDRHEALTLGKWELLSGGEDVMIFAVGSCVQAAMQAGIQLAGKDISAGVVDARFVKPMDTELLTQLAVTVKIIVTVEENTLCGGFGEGVAALLSEKGIATPVLKLGVADCFVPHGSVAQQRHDCGLDAEGIARSVERYRMENQNA